MTSASSSPQHALRRDVSRPFAGRPRCQRGATARPPARPSSFKLRGGSVDRVWATPCDRYEEGPIACTGSRIRGPRGMSLRWPDALRRTRGCRRYPESSSSKISTHRSTHSSQNVDATGTRNVGRFPRDRGPRRRNKRGGGGLNWKRIYERTRPQAPARSRRWMCGRVLTSSNTTASG
jgi:hypothetical protein